MPPQHTNDLSASPACHVFLGTSSGHARHIGICVVVCRVYRLPVSTIHALLQKGPDRGAPTTHPPITESCLSSVLGVDMGGILCLSRLRKMTVKHGAFDALGPFPLVVPTSYPLCPRWRIYLLLRAALYLYRGYTILFATSPRPMRECASADPIQTPSPTQGTHIHPAGSRSSQA